MQSAINRLEYLCSVIPSLIDKVGDHAFSEKFSSLKWSKKEILGHLIDSATNNHQRFIRCQFEDKPRIWYDQDNWNRYGHYQELNKSDLVNFWRLYNLHLVEILKRIPAGKLNRVCVMQDQSEVNLENLIIDYVKHLEHHLKQIVEYEY